MQIIKRHSPNYNHRPGNGTISLIVIHGTAGQDETADIEWCMNPLSRVSYHFLIGRTGTVYQLVAERERAWHAGVSSWHGTAGVNDFSIGIGLANRGPAEPFAAGQYAAAGELCRELMTRHGLRASALVGHCHVSPGRKQDPWLHFHWGQLFEEIAAR